MLKSFAALQWPGNLHLNLRAFPLPAPYRCLNSLPTHIATVGLHPSQITLELTEHDPIPNTSSLLRMLGPLFDEGMTLVLDDVGAGFARMRVICELQPHLIKDDRFFITGIVGNLVKQRVVHNFANLASDIGAKIIAEGAEHDEDAWTAMQLGVDFVQGHLFGKAREKPNVVPLAKGFWTPCNKLHRSTTAAG